MGVRSGVTRAEQMLKTKLKNKRQVQVMWRKVEGMHRFYACSLFSDPVFLQCSSDAICNYYLLKR